MEIGAIGEEQGGEAPDVEPLLVGGGGGTPVGQQARNYNQVCAVEVDAETDIFPLVEVLSR